MIFGAANVKRCFFAALLSVAAFPVLTVLSLIEPEFAKAYVTLLSEKIIFLNKKISAYSEGDASEKVLRWILTMANGESELVLPCSVSKLAQMLGIGRASVYRAFDALQEQGIIGRIGKKIVLLKP